MQYNHRNVPFLFFFYVNDITSRRENTAFRIQTVYAAFLSNPWGCLAARKAGITYVIRVGRCKSRGTIAIDRRRSLDSRILGILFIHGSRENFTHGTRPFLRLSRFRCYLVASNDGSASVNRALNDALKTNSAPGNITFFFLFYVTTRLVRLRRSYIYETLNLHTRVALRYCVRDTRIPGVEKLSQTIVLLLFDYTVTSMRISVSKQLFEFFHQWSGSRPTFSLNRMIDVPLFWSIEIATSYRWHFAEIWARPLPIREQLCEIQFIIRRSGNNKTIIIEQRVDTWRWRRGD